MKKTSKLVILALLVVGAVMTLCACGLVENAQSIEIVNPPKQDYVTTDTEFDWTGFQIKVTKNDGSVEYLTYAQLESAANFTVSAFDNSAGKHTAIITYMGVSVAFEYTVNAGLFAGGDGTEANPYQIATAEQFYALREGDDEMGANGWNGTYFELINDIDFKGDVKWYGLYLADGAAKGSAAGFILNGNGYAFRNVNDKLFDGFGAQEYASNPTSTTETVLTNVDLYIIENGGIASMLAGKSVEISDVNIYGAYTDTTKISQNAGLVSSMVSSCDTILKDISIYADMITYGRNISPFIGGYVYKPSEYENMNFTFNSCNYFGTAQAQHVGLFLGNANTGNYVGNAKINISISNSANYGEIVAGQASYFGYQGYATGEATNIIKVFGSEPNLLGKVEAFKQMTYTTENGVFKFNAVDGATSYRVFVSVWGNVYTLGGVKTGTNTTTVYSNLDAKVGDEFNYGTWTVSEDASDSIETRTFNATRDAYKMEVKGYDATYVVFALDESGSVIGFAAVTAKVE